MQELRVIGAEDGALVALADSGERFRIVVDDTLHAQLRRVAPPPAASARKLSPREIQAHIRSGMSAADVAAVTGAPLEYVQRFEGPVLAEREWVVQSALAVPVHTAVEPDPLAPPRTFGTVLQERLQELGATGERWTSWREQGAGWIVKLAFTVEGADHDARWQFDPRKLTLVPLGREAITLSQQDDSARTLLPRLRAVTPDEADDASRFDSGAFEVDEPRGEGPEAPLPPSRPTSDAGEVVPGPDDRVVLHPRHPRGYAEHGFAISAIRQEEPERTTGQTADLLEALRRRRGERDASSTAAAVEDAKAAHPSTGSIRLVDVPLDGVDDATAGGQQRGQGSRKGRASMPSWDEIVFGARPDDDLA